jgi:hypothetical protein
MKKITSFIILTTLVLSINVSVGNAFSNDPLNKFRSNEDHTKLKLEKDLKFAKKEHAYKIGKIIDFYLDLQLGYGVTNASIDRGENAAGEFETESKGGITAGALFFLSLFDAVRFSSGISFVDKRFEVNPPAFINPIGEIDTTREEISNKYINIPLNFNFGGMISEKFGLMFNGGPYLGLLLSTDEKAGFGYKNFDLGLNGTLTANYVVAPLTSVILGTRFEYGGLNNLGKTDFVNKITTNNFSFFSGIRFAI